MQKKIVKLTGHSHACNGLTNFEYEGNAMIGNSVKLSKFALIFGGFWPFGTCVVAEAVAVEAALTSWPLNGLSSQLLLGGDSISNGLRLRVTTSTLLQL